jgi:hypothetical protein
VPKVLRPQLILCPCLPEPLTPAAGRLKVSLSLPLFFSSTTSHLFFQRCRLMKTCDCCLLQNSRQTTTWPSCFLNIKLSYLWYMSRSCFASMTELSTSTSYAPKDGWSATVACAWEVENLQAIAAWFLSPLPKQLVATIYERKDWVISPMDSGLAKTYKVFSFSSSSLSDHKHTPLCWSSKREGLDAWAWSYSFGQKRRRFCLCYSSCSCAVSSIPAHVQNTVW